MRICEYNNSDDLMLSGLLFWRRKSEYLVSLLISKIILRFY